MTPKPSSPLRKRRGFSLVEVVVAVGIFAIAIVSVIGLVAAITRTVSEVVDVDDASRLAVTVQGQLQNISFTDIKSVLDTPPTGVNRYFANRTGSIVAPGNNNARWNPGSTITDLNGNGSTTDEVDAQKYFLIEINRNGALSLPGNDATAGFLALNLRIIYPAYLGNGQPVANSTQQNVMIVPVAITR